MTLRTLAHPVPSRSSVVPSSGAPSSTRASRTGRLRATVGAAVLAVALAALTACSDDGSGVIDDKSPDEVLAIAADHLASTKGATLTLEASGFPSGTNGIVKASGVSTSAPAFDGELTVRMNDIPFDVPVIAVDGTVWAQIPLTQGWSDIDPASYGAPDPSQLLTSDNGVGALLAATSDPKKGKTERGGKNNDESLTSFSGTIAGDLMKRVIPSSAGDVYDVDYLVTEDGHLSEVVMEGVFYADTPKMTYTLTVSDYGRDADVKAP